MPSTRDLQARLAALGYPPGPIDGLLGTRTKSARDDAIAGLDLKDSTGLWHPSGLHRIHWHWTAGADGVIDVEEDSYHFLVARDGAVIEGELPPEANASTEGPYAAHTLNANGGAIGIALDSMAGAQERPFRWGSTPMTWAQVNALVELTAELCARYWIPVSRWSTLSHAEVQPTLGIAQRWKWDITVLPGMSAVGDAVEIGDRIRADVRKAANLDGRPDPDADLRRDLREAIALLKPHAA